MNICVVGGGWAGLAAAVAATQAGHQVTVLEAAHHLGGRARAVPVDAPDGSTLLLDNGQHILIGAYTQTLRLMRTVGVDPEQALLRYPLNLSFPDGGGLVLPNWPSPFDALAGIWSVRGWSASDRGSMLQHAARWQWQRFRCAPHTTVTQLCAAMSPVVMQTLIEPLCVSALNTPAERASAQVFLRVLHDALLGGKGSSNLLIPRVDLSALLPDAAQSWLLQRGAQVRLGCRVHAIRRDDKPSPQSTPGWQVQAQQTGRPHPEWDSYDAVVLATSSQVAAQLVRHAPPPGIADGQRWAQTAAALCFESIGTVYLQASRASGPAFAPGAPEHLRHLPRLPHAMLALHSSDRNPAQFVFDRGQLGGPAGLLAFVVSASTLDRQQLTQSVLGQAQTQLSDALQGAALAHVQTIVEKRATFACTPGLLRPTAAIAPGLWACGDYVEGPYPATLEGAVRCAQGVVDALA